MTDEETFTRLIYFCTVQLRRSESEVWLMPIGYLLDLWACHKQFLGLEKPKCELFIDDIISNVKSWIMDKIRGFMSDITSSIRSFFGINSPSTVFADIGRNLGLGIGVGFEDAMDQVSRDMQNAIPTSFNLSPDVRGEYSGAYGSGSYPPGTAVTQNISIMSPKALSEKEAAREFRNLSRKLALGV